MKIERDRAYAEFLDADKTPNWRGVRIKDVRARPLYPGGRARLTP
jgi:hypothetical protein